MSSFSISSGIKIELQNLKLERFGGSITRNLVQAGTFTDSDTFYAHEIALNDSYLYQTTILSNSGSFYNHVISVDEQQSLSKFDFTVSDNKKYHTLL